MANDFYTPEQVARVAVALTMDDAYLSAMISRDLTDDFLGGGGKGRTVNVKIPSALIARSKSIDDKGASIVMDELTETTVPVTLGTHAYSAVSLSEGDLNLELADFSRQVLRPQAEAVADWIENDFATLLLAETENNAIAEVGSWDPAKPVATLTKMRKVLRKRGVPQSNLRLVVGTDVYAALLDADAITSAEKSGSTAALREGNVGRVRGFDVVESTRVGDGDIFAFHRDAYTLAVRAPATPEGASFGRTVSEKGFGLRYLRDYSADVLADRSIVSTFTGCVKMPLYQINRDYGTPAATVDEVTEGAVVYVDTTTAAA